MKQQKIDKVAAYSSTEEIKKWTGGIVEAIKWAILPITFPLIIALFCIGIGLVIGGYAAIAIFDALVVPLTFKIG